MCRDSHLQAAVVTMSTSPPMSRVTTFLQEIHAARGLWITRYYLSVLPWTICLVDNAWNVGY